VNGAGIEAEKKKKKCIGCWLYGCWLMADGLLAGYELGLLVVDWLLITGCLLLKTRTFVYYLLIFLFFVTFFSFVGMLITFLEKQWPFPLILWG